MIFIIFGMFKVYSLFIVTVFNFLKLGIAELNPAQVTVQHATKLECVKNIQIECTSSTNR